MVFVLSYFVHVVLVGTVDAVIMVCVFVLFVVFLVQHFLLGCLLVVVMIDSSVSGLFFEFLRIINDVGIIFHLAV